MEPRNEPALALDDQLPVDLADLAPGREVGERVAADRDHHAGADQRQLLLEPRQVMRHFARLRIAVAGRARLDDVGDVYVLALQPRLGEQLVEQLARAADERAPLLVLARAGRLADEHHVRRVAALARNEVGGALADLEAAAA